MILCDTGPLVALIDRADQYHQHCVDTLPFLDEPLITTLPCITEAMYLLFRAGGLRAQSALWEFLHDGLVACHELTHSQFSAMQQLMIDFADSPMDFADASLMAICDDLSIQRVFTLDRHFHAYRTTAGRALIVIGSVG